MIIASILSIIILSLLLFTFSFAQAGVEERLSPSDWVKEDQIHVFGNKIILSVENAQWSRFTNTNSMDPLFDDKANALQIKPRSPTQIQRGDIISYHQNESIYIHRVINVGEDSKGFYYIAKGDNVSEPDQQKIRFEQIEGVVVGIIY